VNLGIRTRTLFTVIMPLLAVALILGSYFVWERIEGAGRDLSIQGQRYGQYLAAASEFNLISGNHDALQEFADSNLRVSDLVRSIAFLDARGRVLVAVGERREIEAALICLHDNLACNRYQSRLFFSQSIESVGVSVSDNPELMPQESGGGSSAQELAGRVIFMYDTRPLRALQQRMLVDGLLITGAAALAAGLLALFFANGISRPILELYRVVSAIQHGDLGARTTPAGGGELRQLEEGINAMAAQVEEANADLQQRVENATTELRHALAGLERQNHDLEEARLKAEEASRAKDLFLARMSHELRTPLASVIGYSRLLENTEDREMRRDYGRVIDQASKILLTNIDDILDFIRLEEESVRLEQIEFDLVDTLENVVSMQAPEAHRKQLELICCCDDSLPRTVRGDAVRIAQIATNLLSNAIKFTESGHVLLHAEATYAKPHLARVTITVVDTGIGIPKEKQAQLFQPFVQADESITRRFGGSGLGLSITRKLAQCMGGDINLSSEAGQGVEVTVKITVPVIPQAELSASDPILKDIQELTREQRIVVYDPSRALREVLNHSLSPLTNNLEVFDSSEALLHHLESHPTNLLVFGVRTLEDSTAQLQRIHQTYNGDILLLYADSPPVDAHAPTHWNQNIQFLEKPVRRDKLRQSCIEFLLKRESTTSVAKQPNESAAPKRSILLVEDNELNRRLLCIQLQRAGANVITAADGAEALTLFQEQSFDVVFMDVHMPGMDGITLCKRIKAQTTQVPVYALTANITGSEERLLLDAGVQQILYKPLDELLLQEILRKTENLCPASAPPSDDEPSRLILPSGIESTDVFAEIQKLASQVKQALVAEAWEEVFEYAHKILGVTRLFTRGKLNKLAAMLDEHARQQQNPEASSALGLLLEEVSILETTGAVKPD